MTGRPAAPAAGPNRFAIGCLMALPGFFGGGMVGALVAKIVGSFTGCPPPEGVPACDLGTYVAPGAVIGLVLLPSLVLWRLRRSAGHPGNSARS